MVFVLAVTVRGGFALRCVLCALLVLHMTISAGMGHEKPVTGYPHRQCDVIGLTDNEPLHDEIKEILLIFCVKKNHSAVEEVANFNIIGLYSQWSIDHSFF